ncbi:CsbD family protein [Roseimaritima sediminicola]|uniref:CsbD family protein n=1 Tax=Roseimaritima sediminicola TaxID=2662066 RepID=UPI001386C3A2|nr:CsbD family protein [Roseimaritima sediminicola]
MVTKQQLSGNWNKIVGEVKKKHGQITDNELKQVEGNADQLVGLIQRKTGQSREQIEAMLDDCCQGDDSTLQRVSQSASEAVGAAGEQARAQYDQLSAQARQGYQQSVDTLSKHPLESAGAAFGLGLLAGLAIGLTLAGRSQPPESFWQRRWS